MIKGLINNKYLNYCIVKGIAGIFLKSFEDLNEYFFNPTNIKYIPIKSHISLKVAKQILKLESKHNKGILKNILEV